jgi:hypothetical protein
MSAEFPSLWRTHMVNAVCICIGNRKSVFGLCTGVIDPSGAHVPPYFARQTVRPLFRRWEPVCPSPHRKIRLCQVPVFCIRVLTLTSNGSIPTDNRRLSNLMPQSYQHSLRIWSAVEGITVQIIECVRLQALVRISNYSHYKYIYIWQVYTCYRNTVFILVSYIYICNTYATGCYTQE